ncbi:MAG: hypothetical protein ACLFWF_02335 [Alphaproteobacteria bacterium]
MDVFWFWLLIFLLLLAGLTLPVWPYTRERGVYRHMRWRYAPTAAALGLAMILLVLFWLGLIIIALPRY